MFWLNFKKLLALFYHAWGLIFGTWVTYAMLCIATMQSSLLALSVQVINMPYFVTFFLSFEPFLFWPSHQWNPEDFQWWRSGFEVLYREGTPPLPLCLICLHCWLTIIACLLSLCWPHFSGFLVLSQHAMTLFWVGLVASYMLHILALQSPHLP